MVAEGWIFDIQRYSVSDGPGIRTTVFFKGCPLRCLWCENPESQQPFPQLFFIENLCTRCYRCVKVCPLQAIGINSDGAIEIDCNKCQSCGTCVSVCLNNARMLSGKKVTTDEVMETVRKDSLFYSNSGGGATFSGGEPTMQPEFLLQLLRECRNCGISTALDTCGYVNWEILAPILEYTDLVLYDIKHMDAEKNRELTGFDNKLILENISQIAKQGTPAIVRVPLIPGYNDSIEDITALGEFVSSMDLHKVDILPYHQLGKNKYHNLGMEYKLEITQQIEQEQLSEIRRILESYNLEVNIE